MPQGENLTGETAYSAFQTVAQVNGRRATRLARARSNQRPNGEQDANHEAGRESRVGSGLGCSLFSKVEPKPEDLIFPRRRSQSQ